MQQKKIFFLAGEASGDALAAWYIQKQKPAAQYIGVTGPAMRAVGVQSWADITDLSVVGITQIVRHLPRLMRMMRMVVQHIFDSGCDEVVLVDFPGFNLRVLKKLKQKRPGIKVTYLSPPQMWVWGAWRVKPLARFADRVVVLYPFEVDWYAQWGVRAEWLGSPVVERLRAQCTARNLQVPVTHKKNQILFLPGSRAQEVSRLMQYYAPALRIVAQKNAGMKIVVVVAPTITRDQIMKALAPYQPDAWGVQWTFVASGDAALQEVAHSVCALTKPGTNTLELALLGVPGVVLYKTSWLTYWLARIVVKVSSMTLPNLLTGLQLYPEFIQGECRPEAVAAELLAYFDEWQQRPEVCQEKYHELVKIITDTLT